MSASLLTYNLRSMLVRKATTAASAFGIALVVFVLTASMMLSSGIDKTMKTSGRDDIAIVLRKGSNNELGSAIEDGQLGLILASPGIRNVDGKPLGASEVVVVLAIEKLGENGFSNVQARGVTEESFRLRPEVKIVAGRMPSKSGDEVIIGQSLRGRFKGLDLEQTFELKKGRPARVVGVFSTGGTSYDSEVWLDREALRSAYHREGLVSAVRAQLDSAAAFDGFRAVVEQDKRLGLSAVRETKFFADQSEGASGFITGMGTLVAVFFGLGAVIGAMITMYSAVANRMREIGTLRALGFGRASILFAFVTEAVILSLAGGVIGVLAATSLKFASFSMLNFGTFSEMVFSFDPNPTVLLSGLIFSLVLGLLGGLLPAWSASRVSPVRAMRGL